MSKMYRKIENVKIKKYNFNNEFGSPDRIRSNNASIFTQKE